MENSQATHVAHMAGWGLSIAGFLYGRGAGLEGRGKEGHMLPPGTAGEGGILGGLVVAGKGH